MPKKAKPAKRQHPRAKALRQNSQNLQNDAESNLVHSVNSVKKTKPLYRRPAPKPKTFGQNSQNSQNVDSVKNPHLIAPAHFELREDGSIQAHPQMTQNSADSKKKSASVGEICGPTPRLVFESDVPFVRLYQGNSLDLLDAIFAKYGDAGRFDAIFADPPYFLPAGP